MEFDNIINYLLHLGSDPLAVAFAIFMATFILEDAATVSAAMLVSDGVLSVSLAVTALISGIFLGDLGLYGLGRLSTVSSWVRGLLKRRKVTTVRNWMAPRIWQMVLAARFIPGSRLPSYTASGVLGLSFWRFSLAAFLAVVLQTALLFTLVVYFGIHFREQLGIWRWVFAGGVIIVIILVSRKYRRKQLRSKQLEGRRPASEYGKET